MGLLRRDEPDQTPDEFWAEIEEKRGGKVTFFTFSKFIGRSRSDVMNLPGLLYVINGIAHFEDFEKDNMLSKLMGRKKKYEKTEFSFQIVNVEKVQYVNQGNALKCISGLIGDRDVKAVSKAARIFTNPVYQLVLNTGESLFFEQVMDDKAFVKVFSG
jgi:hypothetical protein